jgi:hypothetical protein
MVESRTVSAPTFAAWWTRLVTLAEERPDDDAVYNLIKTLYEVGLRSRATEPVYPRVDQNPQSSGGVFRREWRLAPSFDWVAGEIDFSALHVDAETLIEALVRTTGIKEHDTDDIPPMAERMKDRD